MYFHPVGGVAYKINVCDYSFDKEGFSVWRVDFKYNDELTQTFMSANQIGGFFNRLEASRKYLFGSVGVLGESNNSIITGVIILRGQEAKPVVEVAPDYESYEYTKLDLENADAKAFFEGALAWDLEVAGKKWIDGKNVSHRMTCISQGLSLTDLLCAVQVIVICSCRSSVVVQQCSRSSAYGPHIYLYLVSIFVVDYMQVNTGVATSHRVHTLYLLSYCLSSL